AAAGGAASTTTVDLSLPYLRWARRSLELNNSAGPHHTFVRADRREWPVEMLDPTVEQELLVKYITRQTIPPDFARTPCIHRCCRLRRHV
ncbi:MAG: hypothetical protein H5T84_09715, partial [Thermoleophilia bacterium]|nr:hypothetical protein [Thermoleophilia bacterium]